MSDKFTIPRLKNKQKTQLQSQSFVCLKYLLVFSEEGANKLKFGALKVLLHCKLDCNQPKSHTIKRSDQNIFNKTMLAIIKVQEKATLNLQDPTKPTVCSLVQLQLIIAPLKC